MKLSDIYKYGSCEFHGVKVVRPKDIPEKWRKSNSRFMFGQTIITGTGEYEGEYLYYLSDFRIWYNKNKFEIERDEKIDDIIS